MDKLKRLSVHTYMLYVFLPPCPEDEYGLYVREVLLEEAFYDIFTRQIISKNPESQRSKMYYIVPCRKSKRNISIF